MSAQLELESLVLRIIGDASSAKKALKEVQQDIDGLNVGNIARMGDDDRRGFLSKLRVDSKKMEEAQLEASQAAGQKKWDDWTKQTSKAYDRQAQFDAERARDQHNADVKRGNQEAARQQKILDEHDQAQRQLEKYRHDKAKDLQAYQDQLRVNSNRLEDAENKKREAAAKDLRDYQDQLKVNSRRLEDSENKKSAAKMASQQKEVNDILDRVNARNAKAKEDEGKRAQKLLDQKYKDQEKNDLAEYRRWEAENKRRETLLKQTMKEQERAAVRKSNAEKRLDRDLDQQKKAQIRENERLQRQANEDYRRKAEEAEEARARARVDAVRALSLGAGMMGGIGAGLLGGFGASLNEYAKFNLAMTESTSIMDVNEKQAKRMKDQVFELAQKGPQAPAELAKAYYFLASAGMSAEAAISALPAVQAFATASAMGMEKATSLASNALMAMGMSSKDAGQNLTNLTRLTDVLVKANNLADGTAEQFAQALTKQTGAAARAFGMEIEEVVAILSVMASQGDKGVTAGTHLSMMLRHLTETFTRHQEAYKRFGISIFDTTGKIRKSWEILNDMGRVFKPMSDRARTEALLQLGFQARLQQSIMPLIGKGDEIKEFFDQFQVAKGTSAEVQAKQMQAFTNQMKVMHNILTMVAIDLGELLAPAFIAVGNSVKDALIWFKDLPKDVLQAGVTIGFVTGLFLTAAAAVAALVAGVIFLGPYVVMAAAALTALAVISGVVIGALIQGGGGIANVWGESVKALQQFWEWMKPVRQAVMSFTQTLVSELPKAWKYLVQLGSEAWQAIGGGDVDWKEMRDNLQRFFIFAEYWVQNFQDVNELAWVYIKLKAVEAFNFITENFGKILFVGLTGGFGLIATNWSDMNNFLKDNSNSTWMQLLKGYDKFMRAFLALGQGRLIDFAQSAKEIKQMLFGEEGGIKFTPKGFQITNMKELEDEIRAEFERLNGEVGTQSEKWKEFLKKKLLEFDMDRTAVQPFKFSKLNLGLDNAKKAYEAYTPGDHMLKQMHKIDAAEYGSAEALSRMEHQFDMLNQMFGPVVQGDKRIINEPQPNDADFRRTRSNPSAVEGGFLTANLLERINNGINELIDNTADTVGLAPANFTG